VVLFTELPAIYYPWSIQKLNARQLKLPAQPEDPAQAGFARRSRNFNRRAMDFQTFSP
jgi:hypothetical protein